MHICRLVVRNYRNFRELDVQMNPGVTYILGENNSGKSNLLQALRMATDSSLSIAQRNLTAEDLHSGTDFSVPNQVLVSVEFSDLATNVQSEALTAPWLVGTSTARLHYRFRPRPSVRDEIEAEVRAPVDLSVTDYDWELTGGGAADPAEVGWNEDLGSRTGLQDLQPFRVTLLPALRDVEQNLRRSSRESLLKRLLDAGDLSDDETESLIELVRDANDAIEGHEAIHRTGDSISDAFELVAGDAFAMDVRVGVAEPTFVSIVRSLRLLLSDRGMTDFDVERNGLGLNNVLYVAMLLELFQIHAQARDTAGQLLLVEEPEAHLHPQLQRVLHNALAERAPQAILTTHSTHISSIAPLDSFLILTPHSGSAVSSTRPSEDTDMDTSQLRDLERYLDATRSELMFARKVMLVEGPAEAFLIPVLAKAVLDVDLDRHGIAVVPIYGTHFGAYSRLFGEDKIQRRCAIIADGDLKPSDVSEFEDQEIDDVLEHPDLASLESDFVRVFSNKTTFERAITVRENIPMLAAASRQLGATRSAAALEAGLEQINSGNLDSDEKRLLVSDLRRRVLNVASGKGKARFAQTASTHVTEACRLPKYIRQAIEWLLADDST